jgi:hypothetical protein
MPIIPALGGLRQEDLELRGQLGLHSKCLSQIIIIIIMIIIIIIIINPKRPGVVVYTYNPNYV